MKCRCWSRGFALEVGGGLGEEVGIVFEHAQSDVTFVAEVAAEDVCGVVVIGDERADEDAGGKASGGLCVAEAALVVELRWWDAIEAVVAVVSVSCGDGLCL